MIGIGIDKKVPVELGKIQIKALTIKGCIGSPNVWPSALKFLNETKLDLSPIQTHFYPLENAEEAFEKGRNTNGCIKVTITNV